MSWAAVAAAGVGVAGGFLSSAGSQKHNNQSSSSMSWDPFAADGMGEASRQTNDLFAHSNSRYWDPYSMYVGPNGNQTNAANLQNQYASNFALPNAAMGNAVNTLNGAYLDPKSNPYLQGTFDMAANQVQGRVNSDFNRAGRYGSGLQSDTYQKNLNDLATQIYGGNYQNERNRQVQTMGLSSQLAGLPFINTQAMMNAGAQQQQWAQDKVNAPINRIQTYESLLRGTSPGPTQTTNTPYYTNPLNSALGFGLGAYGLMNKGGGNTNWWGGQNYGGGDLTQAWGGVSPDMYSGYYGG